MANFNRVILVGNATRAIELKYTQSQMAVTEIGMAINDKRKNAQGEWVEETTFVDITLWGRTAEVASEYLKKGAPVLIEGRLKYDTWQTTDGQKRSKLRVVGEKMQMLSTRSGGGGGGGSGGGGGGGGRSQNFDESEYSPSTDDYDAPPMRSDAPPMRSAAASAPPNDDIPF